MKLSLSWIFDHIVGSWHDHDIKELIARCNTTTAELESYHYISVDLSNFTLVRIVNHKNKELVVAYSAEFNKEYKLPFRQDAVTRAVFLIKVDTQQWVTSNDLVKNNISTLIPEIYCTEKEFSGLWKETFETEDYILSLDNKAITHRPDLWGHRGFAREFAALLNLQMVPEQQFLAQVAIKKYEHAASATELMPYSFEIKGQAAQRLAGLYINEMKSQPCVIPIMHRLLRVDARPLNALIDFTNYVMFDFGHPMHAFDAAKITRKKICAQFAHKNQEIILLDDQMAQLTSHDIIISDGQEPLAIAGIMGGIATSISHDTTSLILEAGAFDGAAIRKTSARIKKRTEASARFEKNIDPMGNVPALLRYVKLLQDYMQPIKNISGVASLGYDLQSHIIKISHELIEQRIGAQLPSAFIQQKLSALGFLIQAETKNKDIIYTIIVPTYRLSDVTIAQDIIEEIARYYGFDHIKPHLPALTIEPFNMNSIFKLRHIKDYLAFTTSSHEVRNYALYDEEFLSKLNWHPKDFVEVQNPVSQHFKQLVTSLVPHLIKNIYDNMAQQQRLNFFEINRVWYKTDHKIHEEKKCAGIFFDAQNSLNFYLQKNYIQELYHMLLIPVVFKKPTHTLLPWYHPYQTACIEYNNKIVGTCGIANPTFLQNITDKSVFIYELNLDELYHDAQFHYKSPSKYQDTWLDVSMMIPNTLMVEDILQQIKTVDERIFDVQLIDFFEKPDWVNQRSITIRFYAKDAERTLIQDDIDKIYNKVIQILKDRGAQIR